MVHDLARDTSVARLESAPGWYTAVLPEHWSFISPSGGVLMSVALRAMQAELGTPDMRVRSANTLFCSPVPAGPLEIRVEILRKGNTAAQVRAALSSTSMPGPGLEVSATFARDREGPDMLDARPPQVPRPQEARPIVEHKDWVFYHNFDMRLAYGPAWWEPDWPPAPEAKCGRWVRYLIPQRSEDGTFDPLAIPPIADLMPSALAQKLGPNRPRMHCPSLDLTVHFVEPTVRGEWILTFTHMRRARMGYATADVEVWDEDGTLIAFATQTMMLRPRRPRPPVQGG